MKMNVTSGTLYYSGAADVVNVNVLGGANRRASRVQRLGARIAFHLRRRQQFLHVAQPSRQNAFHSVVERGKRIRQQLDVRRRSVLAKGQSRPRFERVIVPAQSLLRDKGQISACRTEILKSLRLNARAFSIAIILSLCYNADKTLTKEETLWTIRIGKFSSNS